MATKLNQIQSWDVIKHIYPKCIFEDKNLEHYFLRLFSSLHRENKISEFPLYVKLEEDKFEDANEPYMIFSLKFLEWCIPPELTKANNYYKLTWKVNSQIGYYSFELYEVQQMSRITHYYE